MSAPAWKTYAHDRGFITRDPDERILPIAKPGPAKTGLFLICSSNGQDPGLSLLEYGFDSRTDYWFVGVVVTFRIVDPAPRVRFPYEPHNVTWCNGNTPLS